MFSNRISSNKFASIVSTAVILSLSILALILMFQVRTIYHDHLKLRRLEQYKADLDSTQNHFKNLYDDINQVGKEFEGTNEIVAKQLNNAD